MVYSWYYSYSTIIIPDGNTVYKMIAASMVTPDNIDMGKDYIIQCIKEAADAMQ